MCYSASFSDTPAVFSQSDTRRVPSQSIMANPVKTYNPASLSDPTPLAYSHSAVLEPGSRLVYLAGQVGFDKDGHVAKDFSTQARQAFQNVKTCLVELGGTIRHIVSMNTYLVDYDAASSPIWDLHKEFLTDEKGTHFPAGAVIPVPALAMPELKVEVQCIVALCGTTLGSRGLPTPIVDVVVVGAGLSGMQAATDVHEAGLSCVVLEAKDRVGGKTCSVKLETSNGTLDIGGAWINDQTQPKMYALFQKYSCEAIVQPTQGDEVFRQHGLSKRTAWPGLPPVGEEHQRLIDGIAAAMDTDSTSIDIQDASKNIHIEDISLGEYFRCKGAYGASFDFWRAWIRALTGTEPDAIGLVYWLDYVKSAGGIESLLSDGPRGAQYMTNRHGM